jgi:hypothetical protein
MTEPDARQQKLETLGHIHDLKRTIEELRETFDSWHSLFERAVSQLKQPIQNERFDFTRLPSPEAVNAALQKYRSSSDRLSHLESESKNMGRVD